jgi:hypothetical protein
VSWWAALKAAPDLRSLARANTESYWQLGSRGREPAWDCAQLAHSPGLEASTA